MTDPTILAHTDGDRTLQATRDEFRHMLKADEQATGGRFPRSRTMRALTSGGAASALALVAVAFLATRPGAAGRLARATPVLNLLRQLGLGLR
jgi:hypothetical protein